MSENLCAMFLHDRHLEPNKVAGRFQFTQRKLIMRCGLGFEFHLRLGLGEKSVSGEPPSCFYISSHPALRDEQRK